MRWHPLVIAALGLGLGCTRSDPSDFTQPTASRRAPAVAPKGSKVKSYLQQPPVSAVTLTPIGAVANDYMVMLAVAPDSKAWACAWASGVRFFAGDHELRAISQQHNAAGAIGFSPDGATLRLGMHDVDVATGALKPQPDVPNLAAWATAGGLPSPPTLAMAAARKSDDGSLIVVGATGATRDRRTGLQQPATGDPDWLIALDGTTRKPTQALWHGRGAVIAIAISDHHVAAAGHGPVRVFARDALTKAIELGGDLPTASSVAWAPDGAMLSAIGERTVAVWRTGQWDAPAASWQVGGDYQGASAFHPSHPLLAVGSRDGHVRIYGVADAQLAQHAVLADLDVGGPVSGLAFSPDGATLLVAAEAPAKQIKRFDIAARL